MICECYICRRGFESNDIYDIKIKIAETPGYRQFYCCRLCCSFPVNTPIKIIKNN